MLPFNWKQRYGNPIKIGKYEIEMTQPEIDWKNRKIIKDGVPTNNIKIYPKWGSGDYDFDPNEAVIINPQKTLINSGVSWVGCPCIWIAAAGFSYILFYD